MSCNIISQYIDLKISEEEFERHLATCEYCRKMNDKINQTLSILDIETNVPGDLAKKILSEKDKKIINKTKKVDFSMILQIAAVVIAGVFLGIVLGKNSNPSLLMSKESKKQKSLIEYREIHHFNTNQNLFN